MLVTVDATNEMDWARLCVLLWPDQTIASMLTLRATMGGTEFLYYLDGEPAGCINLSTRHDYVEGTSTSPVAYVEGIFVVENHRGKGIARSLVERAKGWARQNGCRELASDTELGNPVGIEFHKGAGFSEVGRIVCFVMPLDDHAR